MTPTLLIPVQFASRHRRRWPDRLQLDREWSAAAVYIAFSAPAPEGAPTELVRLVLELDELTFRSLDRLTSTRALSFAAPAAELLVKRRMPVSPAAMRLLEDLRGALATRPVPGAVL